MKCETMPYKNTQSIVLIFLLFFLISSCNIIHHKSKLHLIDKPFSMDSISFRTNGYYYTILENERSQAGTYYIKPLIFYDNGYVRKAEFRYGHFVSLSAESERKKIDLTLKEIERSITVDSFHVQIENTIWDWGLYNQYQDSILIQSYYNILGEYELFDWGGKVLNDSTILFTSKFGYKQSNKPYLIGESIEEIYRFRKFPIKPDSINYIMNHRDRFGKK